MTLSKNTDIYAYFVADLVGKPNIAGVPQPTSLAVSDIEAVNGIGYVPYGDREGRPYIRARIKNGKGGSCIYGHYLDGTRLKEVAAEIAAAVAA